MGRLPRPDDGGGIFPSLIQIDKQDAFFLNAEKDLRGLLPARIGGSSEHE